MMNEKQKLSRRNFLALTGTAATGCFTSVSALAKTTVSADRSAGANDTIHVGVIGCGRQGQRLLHEIAGLAERGENVRVAAVCDIYERHKARARHTTGAPVYHNWQEVVERSDIDGVIIATPDHWHTPMAMAVLEAGKDLYCEKPMALTVPEAKAFRDVAAATDRIVQIGAQDVSQGQWHTAHKIIAGGKIGKVVWSQGSYGRYPRAEDWNCPIDPAATPNTLDWDAFLGSAAKHPFSPERYFRWRKYWDYSGGIATDLHYHKLAPLLVALGPEFPRRVSAAGGIYIRDGREVPDSFVMTVEYPSGHTIVLTSSMANRQGFPAVIRGDQATLYCEGDRVRVVAETDHHQRSRGEVFDSEPLPGHMTNWLECLRTRRKCVCNEEIAYRAMVAIGMAVEAYRTGKTLYWDVDQA